VAVLDNPFWCALTTEQASFARESGDLRWFPADVAPFCAIERAKQPLDAAVLDAALGGCGKRYFAGMLPVLPAGFHAGRPITLLQMACTAIPDPGPHASTLLDLGADDAAAMSALTGLVFPGFFRPRTHELGRYVGIVRGRELVAMGGERLAIPGYREVSAICTHPAHRGHGYARVIVRHLAGRILAEGRVPFLHVRDTNTPARRLYEDADFRIVNRIPLLAVDRESDA